jgi:hypothetical protein
MDEAKRRISEELEQGQPGHQETEKESFVRQPLPKIHEFQAEFF